MKIHVSSEPSLEMMEAMLSKKSLAVSAIVGEELFRIPSVDGVGIGSRFQVGDKLGTVVHFDKLFTTIACTNTSNISIGQPVSLLPDSFKFAIPSVKFASTPSSQTSQLCTQVPLVDWLFNIQEGSTVALYRAQASTKSTLTSGIDMYMHLITVANEAMVRCKTEPVVLRLNFCHLETIFQTFQTPLPIAPNALVASILQLSHKPMGGSFGITVVAEFDSPDSFGGEATQSADIGLALDSRGFVTNLDSVAHLLVSSPLASKLQQGFRVRKEFQTQQEMGIHIDFWDKEEMDSFNTLVNILPHTAKYIQDHPEAKPVLERALAILFFNKTSKLVFLNISQFPEKFMQLFPTGGTDLDILQLRHHFELTASHV